MNFNFFPKRERLHQDRVMSTNLILKADLDDRILRWASELAHEMERMLSAYRPDSFISQINRNAGLAPVECPPQVVDCVQEALKIASLTEGRFDPTIGALTQRTYGFGTDRERIPSPDEVRRKRGMVNYRDVEVHDRKIFLKKPGMALDLGGIGKGHAVSALVAFLKERGASRALISLGGEICCYGKLWNIAIQHPRERRLLGLAVTKSEETTLSTSGDYERFIKHREHHHILDPQTGSQNHFYAGVTLAAPGVRGGVVDAQATAFFNMPEEAVHAACEKSKIGALLIDHHLNLRINKNFHEPFEKVEFFNV
ncbi:MAG: FAD:protein FMN transferase [Candidatus Manganitrophus sp.]|nr:FAD:protein FMN transferase [Candidatus Manganitrophus sp.]MDC4225908.1 FAD:protein FMN transferase [Candidatus Manganitrophus sp.]WDT72806.1 MAG: FAD:protein FMN transferase [Candidatus Manganitrophus sp.]